MLEIKPVKSENQRIPIDKKIYELSYEMLYETFCIDACYKEIGLTLEQITDQIFEKDLLKIVPINETNLDNLYEEKFLNEKLEIKTVTDSNYKYEEKVRDYFGNLIRKEMPKYEDIFKQNFEQLWSKIDRTKFLTEDEEIMRESCDKIYIMSSKRIARENKDLVLSLWGRKIKFTPRVRKIL